MKTNKLNKTGILYSVIALTLIVGFLIGRGIYKTENTATPEVSDVHEKSEEWTCSMHPQIRQDHPGSCPICGMDLIPVEESGEADSPDNLVSLSSTEVRRAGVRTMTVGAGESSAEIHLSGKVTLDPKYVFSQSAHVSGRLEDLFVTNIGEFVKKGQKIGVIYSPELYNAQKELLQAYKGREKNPGLYEAVRQKLRLWKIKDWEIDGIIKGEKPIEDFPIYADYDGYLLSREIEPGEHVEDGTELFTLSQMDKLWGVFDVYEKQLPFVKKGMNIDYSLNAIPGKSSSTTIDFVEPVLNSDTRTATARVLISNADLELKPEMFLNAVIYSENENTVEEINIPKSAVMWTGRESVVYVEKESDYGQSFEMRKVILGPAMGDSYRLQSGLKRGEQIVVEGTFSVDAAAQLKGVSGMMSLSGSAKETFELNKAEQALFSDLFDHYFLVKDALVADDYKEAKKQFDKIVELQAGIPQQEKFKALKKEWNHFTEHLQHMPEMLSSIERFRETVFEDLSTIFIKMTKDYELINYPTYIEHCPMFGEEGADWLSKEKEIRNPYYGEKMLNCGEMVKVIGE